MKRKIFLSLGLLFILSVIYVGRMYIPDKDPTRVSKITSDRKITESIVDTTPPVRTKKQSETYEFEEFLDNSIANMQEFGMVLDPSPEYGKLLALPTELKAGLGDIPDPVIFQAQESPNGTKIAFSYLDSDGKTHGIIIKDNISGEEKKLVIHDINKVKITQFEWLPDGNRMFLLHLRKEGQPGDKNFKAKDEISIIDTDSGAEKKLTDFRSTSLRNLAGYLNNTAIFISDPAEPGRIEVLEVSLVDGSLRSRRQLPLRSSNGDRAYGYRTFQIRPETQDLYMTRLENDSGSLMPLGSKLMKISLGANNTPMESIDIPGMDSCEYFRWDERGEKIAISNQGKGILVYSDHKNSLQRLPSRSDLIVHSFVKGNVIFLGTPPGLGIVSKDYPARKRIKELYVVSLLQENQ